ncbi:hypothetical protein ACET3Z_013175 [Daucus carota]
MDVLKFLRFKGFTEEEIYKELYGSGGAEIPKRDDFGLPNLDDKVEKGNPFVEKLKNKAEPEGTHVVLDEMPNLASQEGKKEQTTSTQPPKSWKWVRKEPKPPVVSGPQVIPPQDPSATTHTTQTPPKPVTAGVSAAENYSTKRPPSPSSPEDLDRSATPTVGFKNLKKVDEIDMKRGSTSMGDKDGFQLSKSQKKRLKKQGKLPSSSP